MTNPKPVTVDNINEAIEWIRTLKKCKDQQNAIRVLKTFEERKKGYVVWMNEEKFTRYLKLVLK